MSTPTAGIAAAWRRRPPLLLLLLLHGRRRRRRRRLLLLLLLLDASLLICTALAGRGQCGSSRGGIVRLTFEGIVFIHRRCIALAAHRIRSVALL